LIFRQGWAFIKRDFLLEISYKAAFITRFLEIFFWVGIFYFLSKLIGAGAHVHLKPYGGEYFPFVLIGIAFAGYQRVGLGAFISSIREEEMMGTLESMLTTPARFSILIISSSLWKFIYATVQVFFYILLGVILFDLDLQNANFLSGFIVLILMIISFSSIGILSASLIIVIKKAYMLNSLVNNMSALLSGVFFPVALLPDWLKIFSYMFPITYSLKAMRHALFQGYTLTNLLPEVTALIIFSIIMLPLSLFSFRYAVKKAKVDGSLGHY
jgi:ABC-2 type transport system permease protein